MPDESGPQSAPEKKTPIRRPRKACTTCRGLKTRCLPDSENSHPNARCSRCARLGLECVYARARRGRPARVPKHTSLLDNSNNQPPPQHAHLETSTSANGPMVWDMPRNVSAPTGFPGATPLSRGITTNNVHTNGLVSPHIPLDMLSSSWGTIPASASSNPVHSTPPGLYSSTGSMTSPSLTGNLNTTHSHKNSLHHPAKTAALHDYMDPPIGGNETGQLSPTGSFQDAIYSGPISSGILTAAEAQVLFTQFIQQIMPSAGLFDPRYHTFERVQMSTVLFTAILSASARFFRPDLVNQLTALADTLITQATMSGEYDLQLVQALLVSIVWRRKAHRPIYLKLGMACRILCELRIDWPQQPTGPFQTEDEEYQQMDKDRTFFNVVSMDLWYSIILRLPPYSALSLPTIQQVLSWVDQHRNFDLAGDYHKAFVTGMWDIQKSITGWHFNIDDVGQLGGWSYEMKEKRLIDHLNLWLNNPNLRDPQSGQAQIVGKVTLLKLRAIGFLSNPNSKITIAMLLNLAEEIGAIISQLARDMIYWYDVICCLLPMPGISLIKVRRHFMREEYGRAIAFCMQLRDIFFHLGNLTVGGDEIMQGISRFYGRLVIAFDQFKTGTEDPQMGSAIDNILHNVPHWSLLVNVVGNEPDFIGPSASNSSNLNHPGNLGLSTNGPNPSETTTADWTWMGVGQPRPAGDSRELYMTPPDDEGWRRLFLSGD